MIYCLDTSSLIYAYTEAYPPDLLPGLWEQVDKLVNAKRLIACEQVKVELERQTDGLAKWAKARPAMFRQIDDARIREVTTIMTQFPGLVRPGGRSSGDPFVVALAKVTSGSTLVTEERLSPSLKKPRIPNVCQHYGIAHTNMLGLMRAEGWKF